MRKTIAIILLALLVKLATAQVSFGNSELINNNWSFLLEDVENGESKDVDIKKWNTIDLPHDWSIKGQLSPSLASCTGYLPAGIAWYRKNITIAESKKNEKAYLYFEGVYNRSEVYINGQLLGKRPNGYISFMYDITPYINYDKENTIAVRVDHSLSADSRWYTGSGIYRNVWLVYANPIHIAQWGVFAYPKDVSKKEAKISVSVDVTNNLTTHSNLTIVNELVSLDGKTVGKDSKKLAVAGKQTATLSTTIKVANPQLWDLSNPKLYTLKTSVFQNGKAIDQTSTPTGIRTYTFDPNKGFALNGEWMKVKGVCIHHDAGVLGSAVPKEVWKRRLLNLKEIGVNAIRTSHNPQATALYDLCDELGILVMNEAYDEWEYAKRKWMAGWNRGTPCYQGTFDYFEEWGEKDLADMVRRDRNHISVFAWSIGNEVDYPNDPYSHPVLDGKKEGGFTQPIFGGYKKEAPDAMRLGGIAKRLAAVVHKYDPSRPVTAGLAGVAMSNETEYPATLDIAGYNYTEGRYKSDHEQYPNRVIYGSENRHDLNAWKAVVDNEYIFGQFLWTGIDYLGESGAWPSRGFYSGLLDFGGFIKPRGYFRQSLWSDKPMAYLGTYPTPGKSGRKQVKDVWSELEAEKEGEGFTETTPSMDAWNIWNYEEGQSIRVVCYTNTNKAKLMLDGQEIGAMKQYDNNTGIIYWDIPFQQGKLEVIGMDKEGKQLTTYAIESSKQPYALKILSTETIVNKDRGLTQIVVQVVDQNGVPVMLSDHEVTCQIAGSARLLGLEGSNNSDMSDYTDNVHRVYNGRILAYIQATGKEGQAKIRFTSPWLKTAEVVVDMR